MSQFERVLIANRGEIARRIALSLLEINIIPVVPVTEKEMKQAIALFPNCRIVPAPDGIYLDASALVEMARSEDCQAIHPGYGFLAENGGFAKQCEDAGIVFIGPPAAAIDQMGNKEQARRIAVSSNVSPVPGFSVHDMTPEEIEQQAADIGFPVLVKASMGGGGKGMRRVNSADELMDALRVARQEAETYFGDASVFIEKYIESPRHIEIQVFAFSDGTTIHLGERECTIQRRHQKIIEESPSVAVSDDLRNEMGAAAVRLAENVGYRSAGTVEFILAPDGSFYFLEMNTRIQVEHPVTEMIYGVDLVRWQVDDGAGLMAPVSQDAVYPRGWAVECRVYAEDPDRDFMPSPGKVLLYRAPEGPGIRVESAVGTGSHIFSDFDPMIAKLVVYGENREAAIERAYRALHDFVILGVTTNREYLMRILRHDAFRSGTVDTGFTACYRDELKAPQLQPPCELVALAHWLRRQSGRTTGNGDSDGKSGGAPFPPVSARLP